MTGIDLEDVVHRIIIKTITDADPSTLQPHPDLRMLACEKGHAVEGRRPDVPGGFPGRIRVRFRGNG